MKGKRKKGGISIDKGHGDRRTTIDARRDSRASI